MDPLGWRVTLSAAALMTLMAGLRSSLGLFVSPLNTASGIGLGTLSLMLALGQLGVGLTQPLLGAAAERIGASRVILLGATLFAAFFALPAAWPLPGVVSTALVGSAICAGAVVCNSVLVGEIGRAVPSARAGLAVGVFGAGASIGQLLFGPATQWAIEAQGWPWALGASAALSLLALPLAFAFRRRAAPRAAASRGSIRDMLAEWPFWRAALSFGVCGFHVSFLAVHMPGVIERCGLPASLGGTWIAIAGAANIGGSIAIGLALRRHDAAWLLVLLYGVRALGVAALLALPPSPAVMLGFALVMGASHMATLPPTSQLVARRYGVERLGVLLGVVMLVHQVGGFAGIWFGGWAAEATGSDRLLWIVDIGLALLAATLVFPGRAPLARKPALASAGT
jgi:MFS family permease